MQRTAGITFLLLLAAVGITAPMHLEPVTAGHDWKFHLANAHEYANALESGTVVAHHTPTYFSGVGGINFKFYPPYSYFPVSLLAIAGVSMGRAFAVAFTLAFLLSGLGAYVWTRRAIAPGPALIAALVYMIAPYHVDDLYRRFAYPELFGLACLPWIFAAADAAIDGKRRWAGAALAALLTVTGLLHNLSGFMAAACLVVYWIFRSGPGLRSGLRLGTVLMVSAGLGMFYALPAVVDQNEIVMGRDFTDPARYSYFGLEFMHLVRVGGGGPLAPPAPGLGLLILSAFGAAVLIVRGRRPEGGFRRRSFAVPAVIVVTLLLTTKAGAALGDLFSPLRYLQFPWRFLGPASLFLAYTAGAAAAVCRGRVPRWIGLAALVIATGVFAFSNGLPERERMVERDEYAFHMKSLDWTGDLENKYLPVGLADAAVSRHELDRERTIWMAEGAGRPRLIEEGVETIRFAVEKADPRWAVVLRRSFTRGWSAACAAGEATIEIDAPTGLIRVRGERVTGPVVLHYRGSPAYRAGVWISLATLLLLCGWMIAYGRRTRTDGCKFLFT